MTPAKATELADSLQACLDQRHYRNQPGNEIAASSVYMCHALWYACSERNISEEAKQNTQRFLNRYVKLLGFRLKVPTSCMAMIQFTQAKLPSSAYDQFVDAWEAGEGQQYYQRLILRLREKCH